DHLGRHALTDLGLMAWLGQDHQPGMAVQVDEPGRDDAVSGIDQPICTPDGVLDRLWLPEDDDPRAAAGLVAGHANGAAEARRARPVDDRAAVDQELVVLA